MICIVVYKPIQYAEIFFWTIIIAENHSICCLLPEFIEGLDMNFEVHLGQGNVFIIIIIFIIHVLHLQMK